MIEFEEFEPVQMFLEGHGEFPIPRKGSRFAFHEGVVKELYKRDLV